jgi:hypothetical protein
MTRQEIAEVIAEVITKHALLAVGDGRFYRLTKQDGSYAGALYRSEIDPFPWMLCRGLGIVDTDKERDAIALRNGILIHSTDTP